MKKKIKNPFIDCLKKIATNQDITSFKVIFEFFGPRLKSFLISSGAEESIAEEIVHETMAIVWNKAD